MEEFFSARVPSSSAEVRGLVIHDIKEVEGVRQEEQEEKRKEMKLMEKSKRSLTVRMKHEVDNGVNEDSNLSQSVRASKQGKQSKDSDTN